MASGPLTVQLRINADGSAAIVGLRNVQGALDNTGQTARRTDTAMASLAGSLKGLAMTAGAALSVQALASSFIQANIESQRLQKGLTAVAGSATAGAAEMAYISATADKLGLSLTATGSAYVSLTAATKGTALEGQATRDIFESVSLAMGKLGKSSADTTGALQAIQQMVSKGTVSAEELRGQLGERLPGAFKLAAEAMGVTEQELGKMLESGDILATDLLPALSQKLNTLYNDGKAVGGLEASWNILNNALDRMMVSADNASGGTKLLGDMLLWATGKANAFAEALTVIDNWRQGKGFAYGERDGIADEWALRARLLDEYVVKMKDAQAYMDANDLDNGAARRAEGEALIARINEIDAKVKTTRADVQAARAEAEALANRNASSMGDDAIRLYREHQAAIEANGKAIDTLNGKYDQSIVKKAEYAKMEAAVAEAVTLGTLTHAEGLAKLDAFAAAQDKAAESSRSHARALSAEAQVVADVEKKYGLMAGQLDAVWKLESSRGKGAGTDSVRWVKDLAAGEGHLTKIVGQFQMAESTAKGLGANMATFNGQADAAGKYLAQAAAQGKTLWEQFAYYHGGPNEKAWGEKTRAYADAAVKIVADATGSMRDLGQNTGKVITDALNQARSAIDGLIQRYLPARAAAEEYARAQQALALASDAAGLSQEEQAIILQGLQQDLEKSKTKAADTASAWAEVWKNAVKRIDDTFAGLWKDLFSGTKSTLESMKSAIASWLAEVAHALLTKPLVVAITTAMTGATGTAGAAGQAAAGAASGASGFGNLLSMGSSLWNGVSGLFSGATFAGISAGWTTAMAEIGAMGYGGAFSTIAAQAGSLMASGNIGASLAIAAPYLLPAIAAIAAGMAIFNKWQKDQEPRYGAFAATTGRDPRGLEKWEWGGSLTYQTGAFGLNFGQADKGSANITDENKEIYKAFADISHAMAKFYGEDVSAKIEASLKASGHLLNLSEDVNEAFDIMFTTILNHGAATGDELAVVFKAVVGDLTGTAEEMANQLAAGMQNALMLVQVAGQMKGTAMGDKLGLAGTDEAAAMQLVNYANAMKTSGEAIGATIQRLVLNTAVLDAALTLTGNKTDATGMAFVTLANGLATAADEAKIGMQGLAQLQALYYQNFFTEEERALKQKEDSLKAIAKWNEEQGLAGIDSSAQLRAYVESLDLTSEAGRAAYVEAMKIIGAFISLDDALKKLGKTVTDLPMSLAAQRQAMAELVKALDPNRDAAGLKDQNDARAALLKAGYQGDFTGASLAEFLDAISQVTQDGKIGGEALLQYREALLALANVAQQKAQMNVRLIELTQGPEAALAAQRKLELAAMDPSLRALQQRIWALEDEADKLAKIKAIQAEQEGILGRLYTAIGADEMALALRRKAELAAAAPSNRPLLEALYAIEDEQRKRQKMLETERSALTAVHEAKMAALADEREAAQALLTTANGLLSAIQSALSALRGAMPVDEISIARSRRQLSGWATSRRLPDQNSLDRAITGIGADDANRYATAAAYRLSQQTDLANLLVLENLAERQVSDAERLLAELDTLQDTLASQHAANLAALEKKYALDEDWKKRQLDLIAKLRLKVEDPNYGISIIGMDSPSDLNLSDAPNPSLAAHNQTQEIVALRQEVALLRKDIAILSTAQATPLRALDDRLKKWDLDGLPSGRDDTDVTLLRAA